MSPEHIDKLLTKHQPKLSTAEKQAVWQRISPRINEERSVASPYAYFTNLNIWTKTAAAALILVVVTSGTVTVADAAKPGDLLFPLERATERVRLAIASEAKASQLRSDLALERFAELEAIVAEEGRAVVEGVPEMVPTPDANFKVEADVFDDITIIKVEVADQKSILTTPLKTRAEIISFIQDWYGVPTSTIEASLDFSIKNRTSYVGERRLIAVDDSGEGRISVAINELLNQLEEVDDVLVREQILGVLLSQIDNISVPARSENVVPPLYEQRLRIDDNRIEVRDDNSRIRTESDDDVRIKLDENSSSKEDDKKSERDGDDDGAYEAVTAVHDEQEDLEDEEKRSIDDEVKEDKQREYDTKKEDNKQTSQDQETDRDDADEMTSNQDDDENQDREDDEAEVESDSKAIRKIEVKVEDGEADVKIEFTDTKLEYETEYTSKETLIAEIAGRTGYSVSAVEAVLSLEIKD